MRFVQLPMCKFFWFEMGIVCFHVNFHSWVLAKFPCVVDVNRYNVTKYNVQHVSQIGLQFSCLTLAHIYVYNSLGKMYPSKHIH